MNRLIKASNKVEVDPEAIHKLLVNRGDFLNALENDIKPVGILLVTKTYLSPKTLCRLLAPPWKF